MWNNELMINTNDGYYYAEGARDILADSHQENDLSPIETPLSTLTAFLANILPISFETLILWMPSIFSSFLVLPIMLIGRVFKQDILGFSAALLGSIAWSYYNRTMIGYYDTDMLIVVLPTFVVWGILYALTHKKIWSFLIAPIFAILAMYWHAGTINIVNGLFIMTFLYTVIFERKNLYFYKFLSAFVLVLTTLPIFIKVVFLVALVLLFHFAKDMLNDKAVMVIAILSSIIYLAFGGFDWIVSILHNAYITRLLVADELDLASLKFFGVVNTVREAGHIPFETFANRISGSVYIFWFSLVGYILMIIRYPLIMLSLPMVVLGFFALQGGLRFTVFSIPFMALGISYLIFLGAKYFESYFVQNTKTVAKYSFVIISTLAVLYPNIIHIIGYKVPTVLTKGEVKVLDSLGKMASNEDYVLSWWDYGYPIRYYADVKTLIDGGKHTGKVNFPVSLALTHSQRASANMARLDVEFTQKSFENDCGASIECIFKTYDVKNPNTFLQALNTSNIKLPQKTRDIYYFLPDRMMGIFSTIDAFSNIDILNGKSKARPYLFISKNFKENENIIDLGRGVKFHKKSWNIQLGKQMIPIKYFAITEYDAKNVLQKKILTINKNAHASVIFMKNYNQFLVLDDRMFNSTYIQLFVLENIDPDLFEPVILTPYAKVYKLKI